MIYGDFYKGIGISDSEADRFPTLINVDVHSKTGKVQCSFALTDIDSGGIVDSLPTCSLVTSAGDTFIGAGTKIFKIASGVISLVHTNTQGAVLGLGGGCEGFRG